MSWLPAGFRFRIGPKRLDATPREHRRRRTELIRAAMLEALDGMLSTEAATLARRARAAGDAERLWYLRVDLMAVLASALGEAAAHARLREINLLFQELLPGSFVRRPGGASTVPAGLESR